MTGNVLVTISGKRMMGEENEDVQLVMPGICTEKNGMHVIRCEEPAEGPEGGTENTILIGGGCMKITKKGIASVQMDFLNRAERTTSCYSTPFGDLLIGIRTKDILIDESSDRLRVSVDYAMELGGNHLSDCSIQVEVSSCGAEA